jgi:hypothetical protein
MISHGSDYGQEALREMRDGRTFPAGKTDPHRALDAPGADRLWF